MRDRLVLFINGRRYSLGYEESSLTLAEFLRTRLRLVGTKVVCNEGDCGACSVLVGRQEGDSDELRYRAMDACILFLFQLDRTHVVTIEGISRGDELTSIQQAMVDCHGSQCGFCTPGFVVTMHGLVETETALNDSSLRYGLSGNLCRCTGYLQIINAGKSVERDRVERIRDFFPDQPIVDEISELGNDPLVITDDYTIFIPRTLSQAIEYRAAFPAAELVSGATDFGVLHNQSGGSPRDILCLSDVAEFDFVTAEDDVLRIGGGATWTGIEAVVEDIFPQYHEIITRFGSPQIRNAGTLAGNLATGSPIGDAIPFHLVMDSNVRLVSAGGERVVPLREFYTGYRKNVMTDDELIAEITTPLLRPSERLVLYKISRRRDLDISTLTLGLWVDVNDGVIENARLAIGGVGETVMRIAASEQYLIGKPLEKSIFREAGVIARDQIKPWSDVRGGADFRLQLTANLMIKAYHEIDGELSGQPLTDAS
jgi:xanthine dehydrogenase small subunit